MYVIKNMKINKKSGICHQTFKKNILTLSFCSLLAETAFPPILMNFLQYKKKSIILTERQKSFVNFFVHNTNRARICKPF
jgi:hypothetical protein